MTHTPIPTLPCPVLLSSAAFIYLFIYLFCYPYIIQNMFHFNNVVTLLSRFVGLSNKN